MIWKREEYIAHLTFEDVGKEMFTELFGPLKNLEPQWRAQGATEEEIGMVAFDWDYVLHCWLPAVTGLFGGEEKLISENETERISIDRFGRTVKLCKNSATIPLPLNYPVADEEGWMKLRPRYEWTEDRIDTEALRQCAKKREQGYLQILGMPGGYDELRELMGEENLSYAFYDEPEMLQDMLGVMGDTCVKALERMADICPPDVLCVHEDLAGKSGPLCGPNQIREFLKPYYRKVWDLAQQMGCRIFSQDSDGNTNSVIDAFLECGVNCFYPFEPMAGMDMVESRKKYGKAFAVKGGIDKFALLQGKDAIRRELEYKMQPLMRHGGCVFALDHRIPNGVPLEDYKYYVNTGREILGLPPISGKGWERMAF